MTHVEIECRCAIRAAERRFVRFAEQRGNYESLVAWHADPANAEQLAGITAIYVAAMQRDPKLD